MLLALVAGCTQGEGDSCQVTDDCESGLICDARGGARGTCVTELPGTDEPDEEPDASEPLDDEDAGG